MPYIDVRLQKFLGIYGFVGFSDILLKMTEIVHSSIKSCIPKKLEAEVPLRENSRMFDEYDLHGVQV